MLNYLSGRSHEILSTCVLLPFYRLQQAVRPSRRPIPRAFYSGLRLRREAIGWGEEEKRKWVLDRLRFSTRRAYDETVYYRELFDRVGFDPRVDFSFDEFAQLPVLGREAVHSGGDRLLSRSLPSRQVQINATGGSTGVPTQVWLGPEELGWRDSGVEHFMRRIGVPNGTRTALLWGHHLDPVASDRLHDRLLSFAMHRRWFDCFRLSPAVFEDFHRQLEQWRPSLMVAYAGALGHFAEFILERGYRPQYPTTCFVTGAEKLLPEHRDAIERAFGRPVHERYGSRDIGMMGFQLSPTEALDYTVDWANFLVEPETDEPDAAILVTKLHADAMPMIRYRVDDIGRFRAGSKPGHPAFVLHEVLGRTTERIWLPNGRWLHGIQFPHLMKDFPVREFMLVQRSDYSVTIKIVPKDGFAEESATRIKSVIAANLPGVGLSVETVNEIPKTQANKWRPVVSEVSARREQL